FTLGAYDPDGDSLTFSAPGLPSGLSLNAATGVASAAPTPAGTASVTVTASDGHLTASQTFHWLIVNGEATVANPGDQTGVEGSAVLLQIGATFPDGQTASSFTATGLPSGLGIDSAGHIAGTISYAAAEDAPGGMYNVTVVAVDASGDMGGVQFAWDVSDVTRPPTVTDPGSQ